MTEARLQSQIISWIKLNRVYVIKTKPGAGTPVGCPDIIGLFEDKWLAIEVKASDKAKFQAGQQYTLQVLGAGNQFVYVATPENWPLIKDELIANFF